MAERILGSRTLAALTSPHGVDRYLEQINPMWAATEARARVVGVTRESDGEHPVATITLQPTSTWRGHRAGQYVQVGVEIKGARRTTRCFSISSPESDPGEPFTITVRAHAESQPGQQRLSRFLVREAQPGQVVHLSQAEGRFTLDESPATPTISELLMISGGSGITPVMSQIRTLLRDGYDGRANCKKVTFLHCARSAQDQIFAEELNRIAWQDNGIDVHLRHGEEHFSAESLARLVPHFRDTDTWACGTAPMMAVVNQAYGDSPRLRTEFFKVATGAPGDGSSVEGDIFFNRAGRTAPNSGASLLERAEAQGLTPEYGCRMGICLSCVSRKTEGTVRNVLSGEQTHKSDNKVTPEQIEAFGEEIDAVRQRLISQLGEEGATYIRGIVKRQRQLLAQLHPPHLHQHPRQGPRHRPRHPADGRGPEVAPVLPRPPDLRDAADALLRVGVAMHDLEVENIVKGRRSLRCSR